MSRRCRRPRARRPSSAAPNSPFTRLSPPSDSRTQFSAPPPPPLPSLPLNPKPTISSFTPNLNTLQQLYVCVCEFACVWGLKCVWRSLKLGFPRFINLSLRGTWSANLGPVCTHTVQPWKGVSHLLYGHSLCFSVLLFYCASLTLVPVLDWSSQSFHMPLFPQPSYDFLWPNWR